MATVSLSSGLDAAIKVISRIEALPLVRRRGQPKGHREPVHRGQNERWCNCGGLDEGGNLLLLAAQAAPIVSRWELETSFHIARQSDEWWARNMRQGFEPALGDKPSYQLVEILEALVHDLADLPGLTEILVPRCRTGPLGSPYLFHEIRRRSFRMMVEVSRIPNFHVEIDIEDYGGTKQVGVRASNGGIGTTYYSGGKYEQKHVRAIRALLETLVKEGMLRNEVLIDKNLQFLADDAGPNSPEWEP